VGMVQESFLQIFFRRVVNPGGISTILVESGLTGIWHYYYFENDILKEIKMITDYQINKDSF
jgi:hypothetical protein